MLIRSAILIFLCVARSGFATDFAQATADVAPELIRGRALRRIPDLTWNEIPESVQVLTIDGKRTPVARFRGKAPSLRGCNLIYTIGGVLKVAKVSESDASVEIFVPLTQRKVAARLRAIDVYGKTYDDGIEVNSSADERNAGKKLNFDVGLGISYLDYVETAVENSTTSTFSVTELGVTIKAGVNYQLSHRWELGGNGFITAVPMLLSASPSGLTAARWVGFNGRAGFRLFQPTPLTSIHLLGGYYIWGMLMSAPTRALTYGVERLGGPQLFLTSRSRLKNGHLLNLYLKFASIQDVGLVSLTNRELSIGSAYQISRPEEGKRRWMLTFDIANAQFARANQSFQLNSYSLGLSTNF